MTGLRRDDGLGGRGDDLYAALIAAHEGLDDAQSLALNARLVLLLVNELGDPARAAAAIAEARRSLDADAPPRPERSSGIP